MNTVCQALAVVLNQQLDQELLQLIKENRRLKAELVNEIDKYTENGTFCNHCRQESHELVTCDICAHAICSNCSTRCCSDQWRPKYRCYDDSGHHVCTRCQTVCSECGRGRRLHCLRRCGQGVDAPIFLCKEADGSVSECEEKHARECAYFAEFECYGYN
jgi:hypothetical protein